MQKSFKFTSPKLETLPTPTAGENVFYDDDLPQLMVRVRSSGAAAFGVRYRIKGDPRGPQRLTLGAVGTLAIRDARDKARAALVAASEGRDPAAERRAAGAAAAEARKPRATLADLIDAHEREQEAHGVLSAKDSAKSLRREFKPMLKRDPASITRAEIVAVFDKIRAGTKGHAAPRPGAVANIRARIHGLLAWAENSGRVPRNVMAGYRSKRRSKAERLAAEEARASAVALDMSETAALWRACDDPRIRPAFGAYVKLLILTGARRGEMAQARLNWIAPATDDRPALLTIPAQHTKSGRAHDIPLPPLAAGVVAGVKRFADTDLVTPGARSRRSGKTAPISGWSKSWPSLLKVAEEKGLKRKPGLHDLRKTFRSHLARLGVPDRVAERMLNHAPTDRLIGIYDKHDYLAERIEAAGRWAAEVVQAVADGPRAEAEIVRLQPARKAAGGRRRAAATVATSA